MANIIPEKGINFAVYYEGGDQLGVAEGTFPKLESMTSEVKGAGIAGTLSSVVLGHFNSISMTLTWRNTTDALVKLAAHKIHELSLYQAQQDYDAGLGELNVGQVHAFLKAMPKSMDLGKLAVGEATGAQTELEIYYMKLYVDGTERLELDKMNYIYKVDGVDYLTSVRNALGKQ